MNLPFFIEAWETPDLANLQICRKVMALLFKQRIRPLPFACNGRDVTQVKGNMASRGMKPGVFIVNTFLAEAMISELGALMGETPAILLRHETHTHTLKRKKDLLDTTVMLKKMDGRQTLVCNYDQSNVAMVAEQVSECLCQFVKDGDFWHFARLNALSISLSDL
jgi:hypothetical protein